MDPDVGRQLLAQEADGVVHLQKRVQRICAVPGGAGVGGLPPELDVHRRAGQRLARQAMLVRSGMDAQRGVHVVQEALAHEAALGAAVLAALLAGGAVHAGLAADLLDHVLERGARQRGGGAEDVVAAAVAEAGQRVILGQEHDHRAGLVGLVVCGEAGAVPGHVHLHVEALGGQLAREALAGVEFVIADLGMGVDVQRDLLVGAQVIVGVGDDAVADAHEKPSFCSH